MEAHNKGTNALLEHQRQSSNDHRTIAVFPAIGFLGQHSIKNFEKR
jgi:hypothetical protein